MSKGRDMYDNDVILENYKQLRDSTNSANYQEENDAIMSLCPDLAGKSVIDLGCGKGGSCVTFSEMGASKVLGIDISKKMLDVANSNNKRENVSFMYLDMNNIDQLNEKYDVAISSLSVHYIKDFRKLLHNIHDLLNDEGIFIFSQEHPLTTAPISGVHWTRDEKLNILHYDLTDYRRDGERVISWIIDGVLKYHRCFSEIINSIIEEGFIIDRMLEPVPTKELIEKLPYYEKSMHKPNYLIMKVHKI